MANNLTQQTNHIVLDWMDEEDEIFVPQTECSKSAFITPKILGVDDRDDLTFLTGPF